MTTAEEFLPELADIIHEVCNVPAAEVTPDKRFIDDLEADSLAMNEIIFEMEDRFQVRVPDGEGRKFHTVGDALTYLERVTRA